MTNETEAPDLKPCPFCGGGDLSSGGDDKIFGAWCNNCQATGPNHYDSRYDWNTRADLSDAKDARIAELQAGLAEADSLISAAFSDGASNNVRLAETSHRVKELEADLAKAVELAEKSIKWLRLYGADVHREAATLAELKGTGEDHPA